MFVGAAVEGLALFLLTFIAGKCGVGSRDQNGSFTACGMRNLWFSVGMTWKKPGQGSEFSIFPALPCICFHPAFPQLIIMQLAFPSVLGLKGNC